MWPQALQLTRDECRGILRRLELESYSQVISVFRAQGGLSDAKAKLLEELRGIFHISNERHRAEARRVANDEQLATIAEAISGPNTWQEWSREGRRPYPMLPRVAPQTALALLANNVADETAQENSKLPYPADTGDDIKEEQIQLENQKAKEVAAERSNVVTSDPFKIPDIPQNPKKNLKRNNEQQNSGANKKKSVGDNSVQQGQTHTVRKNYPHITANSPQANSATTSMTANSDRKQKLNPADPYLEKQRFFHRQHQIAKQKMAKKAAAAAAAAASAANNPPGGGTSNKRQSTPAKSGRRANQKQLAMKQLQMDQQVPMQIDPTCVGGTIVTGGGHMSSATQALLTQQQLDMQFVSYASLHQPPQQIFKEKDSEGNHTQISTLPTGAVSTPAIVVPVSSSNQYPPSLITPLSSAQVAASKRDISKNLNKLQMQQNQQQFSNVSNASSGLPSSAPIPSHDLQSSFGNIISSSSTSVSSSSERNKSSEKTLISTTPVQKYIVEERQPGMAFNLPSSNPSTLVNIQNPHGSSPTQTQMLQVSNAGQQPQIMSFPQISAAATKLRAVNTTLIAPGGKMSSTRKITPGTLISSTATSIGGTGGSAINAGALHELANVASTQSQVLHVAESGGSNNPLNATLATPLHTPPAVIQLHNTTGGPTASSADLSAGTSHGKMLATKILPLVLTGSGSQNTANNSLINNSTLVMASSPTSSVNITSTTSTAGGTTIIKSIPSSVVLNTSSANLTPVTVTSTNNPMISNLGTGAVFRKAPNIMKSSAAASSSTKSISPSSAPHIISNVKLTPVSVAQTSSGQHLNTASTFKNVLPSTSGIRTSVKICQSPNGKVFIQSAGLTDGSKVKLNTTTMPHKILSHTPTANSAAITSSGQRIAIQKVQIIPAPINNTTGGNPLQSAGNHVNTKPGKSNMIFVPTQSTNVRPVTLSKMGNNLLLKSSANQQMTPTSPTTTLAAAAAGDNSLAKSNIVVLSPTPSTLMKDQTNQNLKLENTQLINEDTPLDILNMPIVMEPGVEVTSSSSGAETVTILQSNVIDAANVSSASPLAPPIILDQTQIHQPPKTVVLNVDWEMKLDIEQQNQYNNKNLKQQHKRTLVHSSTTPVPSSQQSSSCTSVHGAKQRRLNNDFISNSLNVTTSTSASNVIVLDDSFEDVIVEEHEEEQQQQQQIDNDIPKILDMQIYQQHDGHDNRVAQVKTIYNDDDVEIDVNDDDDSEGKKTQSKEILQSQESTRVNFDLVQQELHRKQQQQQQFPHVESEIDAGFDETIVTEIDENTALEYIEEDGTRKNVTIPATNTPATFISKKSKLQQKTLVKSLPETPVKATTSIISNEESVKPDNSSSAIDNLASADTISSTTTGHNESSQIEQVEKTSSSDATQETIANNSATQQVEP